MSTRRTRTAFTIVEVLIVVVCIGILAAVVVPAFSKSTTNARVAATAADLRSMGTAIESFHQLYGRWPDDVGTSETNADLTMILGGPVLTQSPAVGGSYDYDNWGGTPLISVDPTTPAQYYAYATFKHEPGAQMEVLGGGGVYVPKGGEELTKLDSELEKSALDKDAEENPNLSTSQEQAIVMGKGIDVVIDDGDPLSGICGYTVSEWYTSYSLGPWNPVQFDPRKKGPVSISGVPSKPSGSVSGSGIME